MCGLLFPGNNTSFKSFTHFFEEITFFNGEQCGKVFSTSNLRKVIQRAKGNTNRCFRFSYPSTRQENSTTVMSYFGLKGTQPNHQLQTPLIPKEAEAISSRGNSILFAISPYTKRLSKLSKNLSEIPSKLSC